MTTVELKLPYDFVPISPIVLQPDWANAVSHDHPLQDGLSGELTVEITNLTPLCIGGEQAPATRTAPGRVHFARTPDGQPYIPGTSLKGMMRAVLEVATLSRVHQLDDQRFAYRDFNNGSEYDKEFRKKYAHVNAGLLSFDAQSASWSIQPCEAFNNHRVELNDIVQYFGLPKTALAFNDQAKSASARYRVIQDALNLKGLATVQFNYTGTKCSSGPYDQRQLVKLDTKGSEQGLLVLTGMPSNKKRFEFIFKPNTEAPLTVGQSTISDFQFVHQGSIDWQFWLKEYSAHRLDQGIPVFYMKTGSQVSSLGLASNYRLPYKQSVREIWQTSLPEHGEEHRLDFASLLFGFVQDESQLAMRGRVNIGNAHPVTRSQLNWSQPVILNGPKASYFPAYLQQDTGGTTYNEKKALLAGVKRYPPRPAELPGIDTFGPENLAVQIQLETAQEDSQWRTKIQFHNLKPQELGALVWLLTLSSTDTHYHTLGLAKAYGYGRMKFDIAQCELIPNDLNGSVEDILYYRDAFVQGMNADFSRIFGADQTWENYPSVKQLLNTLAVKSDPGSYPTPAHYSESKKKNGNTIDPPSIDGHEAGRALAALVPNTAEHLITVPDGEQIKAKMVAQQEQEKLVQQRAAMKKDMSDGALLIFELAELLELTANPATDGKINSLLRKDISGFISDFAPDEYRELDAACALCLDRYGKDNKIAKAAKKVRTSIVTMTAR